MEISLIIATFSQMKLFIWGFISGAIIQYFEIEVGNKKFNVGKFLISSSIMGLLTELSFYIIKGEIISLQERNEEKDIIISLALAVFLYLFIPFVLRPENRGRFIESVLDRFGLKKIDSKK